MALARAQTALVKKDQSYAAPATILSFFSPVDGDIGEFAVFSQNAPAGGDALFDIEVDGVSIGGVPLELPDSSNSADYQGLYSGLSMYQLVEVKLLSTPSSIGNPLQVHVKIFEDNAQQDDNFLLNRGNHSSFQEKASVDDPVLTLTDGATINTSAAVFNRFQVTLGGDRALANPTNVRDGHIYTWMIKQDGTGNRLLSMPSKFLFGTDIPSITLTTTANKTDIIRALYDADLDKYLVIDFKKGF